jgi:hypothetical protein
VLFFSLFFFLSLSLTGEQSAPTTNSPVREKEKEGGRERERERENCYFFIFERNDWCLGTF